jgi:hypothetical protein
MVGINYTTVFQSSKTPPDKRSVNVHEFTTITSGQQILTKPFIQRFYTELEEYNVPYTNHYDVLLIIQTINLHAEHN